MQRIHIDKNLITYEEDGEMVLVNVIKNNFVGLDEMGTHFFKELKQQQSLIKTVEAICQQFDVSFDEVYQDVQAFVLELKKMGVVSIE